MIIGGIMICRNCGQKLPNDLKICIGCGKPIDTDQKTPEIIVKAKMRRPLYLAAFFFFFMMFFYLAAANAGDPFLQIMAVCMLVCAGFVIWVAIFKGWKAINDGQARTTPGKALLYLLVPLFNYYWMFQVFGGFATDYNLYVRRYQLSAPKLGSGWFITWCILIIINTGLARSTEPLAALIGFFATMIVGAIMLNKICKSVNQLPPRAFSPADYEALHGRVGKYLNAFSSSRFGKWASSIAAVLAIIVVFGIIADRIQQNQRIGKFKVQARATAEQLGPALADAIAGFDYKSGQRPSRQLYELMKKAAQHFTYTVLYLPDPSAEEFLWRYQGVWSFMTYEKDWGVRKIPINNDLERAIQKALRGDRTAIDEINLNSRATMQSVISGKQGRPLAVLRFVIPGRGGIEREIK
jgi:hypothetical protein